MKSGGSLGKFLLVSLLGIGLAFPATALAQKSNLTKTMVAYSGLVVNQATVWVAKEAGLLAAEGLDATLLFIASGSQTAQALTAGDVEIAVGGGSAVINAALGGVDLVLIAGMVNVYPNSFFSTRDIKSPIELKGKKIGITRFGSSSQIATEIFMRAFGLEVNRDYTLIQLGTAPVRMAALETGAIQGTTLADPEGYMAAKAGLKELISIKDAKKLNINYQHTAISVSRSLLRQKRQIAERFMRGHVRALQFYQTRRAETMAIMGKYMRISDPEVLAATYDRNVDLFEKVPYPSLKGIQTLLDLNPKAKGARPEQFVDLSIVRELEQSGFIKKVWGE